MRMLPNETPNGKWYTSAAPEKEKLLVQKGKGMIHALAVENTSGATVYAFVYDGTDHNGTLIHAPIPIASHQQGGFDWRYGIPFKKGLYVGLSTGDVAFAAAGDVGWISAGYGLVPSGS